MKKRIIYTLPKGTEPNGEEVSKLIELHKADIKTFQSLESYVDDVPVMERESPNELLTINNFAQYITNINTGYLLGNPVDYKASDETDLLPVLNVLKDQQISELDSELEEDCSMFGQAFENVFNDEEANVRSAKLSVFNTIVVYDDSFKHNKMFAIYYSQVLSTNGDQQEGVYDVTIWTESNILERKLNKKVLSEDVDQDSEHFFEEVPVIHYMNNRRMKGDYEPVLTLIDAYNILQSDRVIDREKLVDALLAFYGTTVTADDQKALKKSRTVALPEGGKAEYIVKNVDEAGADVLRKTIAADIHKFSMTPDLTDETFGNSPSGVSILYKLLAFEQNIKRKERMFDAGLKNRFKLYITVMVKSSTISEIKMNVVETVFTRALPRNDLETSQMINNLTGLVSDETLIGQLSFVSNAISETQKAEDELEEKIKKENFTNENFINNDGSE
jgi:SPP1 family phage portal protein